MNTCSVSIFILLYWFRICTTTTRKSNVGHLIKTKSGKLFLQHSNKTKFLHHSNKVEIDRSFDGNDYQDRGNDYQDPGDQDPPSENKSTEPNDKKLLKKSFNGC